MKIESWLIVSEVEQAEGESAWFTDYCVSETDMHAEWSSQFRSDRYSTIAVYHWTVMGGLRLVRLCQIGSLAGVGEYAMWRAGEQACRAIEREMATMLHESLRGEEVMP